tara:strand:+ start:1931 stop:2662 length:732 start_codon:yes stop_codon:yes gene_type:complete
MLAELERLIRLQQIDKSVAKARLSIDKFPSTSDALDARINERTSVLENVEQRIAKQKSERQELEKSVAEIQTRLSRFKEQSMNVKTNKELWAIQSEIETAENEIQRLEEQILERMLQSDELSSELATAKKAVELEKIAVSKERDQLEKERNQLQAQVDRHTTDRTALIAEIDPPSMMLFDTLSRGRKGIAVGEAKDGRCCECLVRLRPQLYNEVLLNTSLIQCESCQRILYYSVESISSANSN